MAKLDYRVSSGIRGYFVTATISRSRSDPIWSESIRSVSFGESTTVDIVLRVYEILSIVRLCRLESRKNKIYLPFGRDRKIDEDQNSGLAVETAEVKHAKENGPIGIIEWDLIGWWRF